MKIEGAGSAQLVEHEHGVRYTEATAGVRQLLPLWIFAGVSGAAAVGMVAAFGDQDPTLAGVAAVGGATIVFVAFSLLLGSVARSAAKGQLLDFDRSSGHVRGRARRRGWTRSVDETFQALSSPQVKRLERELDDDLYLVEVGVRGRGELELGPVDDEDEARQWCDRLAAVLG